jgi:hypothetical protein
LETIAQVVNQEMQTVPTFEPERGPAFSWKSIFFTAWYYGFFLIGLGLVIISVGKKIIGEQLVADVGSLMALVGVALLVGRGILLLRWTLVPRPRILQKQSDTTPLLEAKEPANVTEFTTRHLDTVDADRQKSQVRGEEVDQSS